MQIPGVLEAHANPVSGRILLLFDESRLPESTQELLLNVLTSLPQELDIPSQPASLITHPLYRLLKKLRQPKEAILKAAMLSVAHMLSNILPLISFSSLLITVQGQENAYLARLGITKPKSQLYFLGFVTALSIAAALLLERLQKRHWRNIAHSVEHAIRVRTFAHLQHLDSSFYDEQSTGRLLALMLEDTANVTRFLENGADSAIQKISSVVVIGLALLMTSSMLALLAFSPIILILLTSRYFQKQIAHAYMIVHDHCTRQNHIG